MSEVMPHDSPREQKEILLAHLEKEATTPPDNAMEAEDRVKRIDALLDAIIDLDLLGIDPSGDLRGGVHA